MEYIGYMGIGALLLAILQHVLYRRDKKLDRKDRELKEAYSGFLNALSSLRQNDDLAEADVNMRYWVARVQLVCSKEVLEWMIELEGSKMKRLTTGLKVDSLIFAMRRDLGISD